MNNITYVTTPDTKCSGVFFTTVVEGHKYTEIDSIPSLYQNICDQNFWTELIIIDLQKFLDIDDMEIIDQITGIGLTMRSQEPTWKLRMALIVDSAANTTLVRRLQKLPEVMGIALTTDTQDTIQECLQSWLLGQRYTTHTVEKMLKRQRKNIDTAPGQIVLTDRQKEILDMISTKGFSNKAIAKVLRITESTVKLHVSAILKKYCLKNRVQLAVYARGG